jgi:Flp pilus assembly protein TadD
LRYARALRKTAQHPQAVAVLQQATIHNPRDNRLLGDYGRALAENGQFKESFDALSRAHTPDQPDWRIFSAQGAVLDQMGRHEDARRYYANALSIAPGESSILSNLGLSYALSKDLGKAEQTLRQAESRGSKDRRVKQNLALVVGLQGRFKEAEEIARADLPQNEAAENIAYLQQMLPRQKPAASLAWAKPQGATKPKAIASTKPTSIVEHTGAIKPRPTPPVKQTSAAQDKSRPLVLGAGG